MHNSNDSKQKWLKVIGFILILILCNSILNYLLVPLSSMKQKFIRYRLREPKNIDFLILGDSLENDGIIKAQHILEEELGQTPYVFAVQGGYPGIYMDILTDVVHNNQISTLIVGWDVLQNMQAEFVYPHKEELYKELIGDGLHTGNWALAGTSLKKLLKLNYPYTFFEWASFPDNITEIPKVLASKRTTIEKVLSSGEDALPIDPDNLSHYEYEQVISTKYSHEIDESYRKDLASIKDFCNKHHIKLYALSSPVPQCVIEAIPYQEMVNASIAMFEELGIPYINGLAPAYFPDSTKEQNFKDCYGHITGPYRETYVRSIATWIKSHP